MNMAVWRLLKRVMDVELSPHAKDGQTLGTRIRKLRFTVVAPADAKVGGTIDERAPLAVRLSEYLSMGYFGDVSERISEIEIFVDGRKAYALSSAKSCFVMKWSHKWRRDSVTQE